jgi:hypothetical protein
MIAVTYWPLFVTILFRGMPGVWQHRHRLVLCGLIVMQALFPGRKTLEELARWTPGSITVWRLRRVLKAASWDVHLLVAWWVAEALQTLPPQGRHTPSCGGWQCQTQARDAASLGPKRAEKRVAALIFRQPVCSVDCHLGRLSSPRGLSCDSAQN